MAADNKEVSVKGKSSQLKTFLGVHNPNPSSPSKTTAILKTGNNSNAENVIQIPEHVSRWGSSPVLQKGGNSVQTLKQIQDEEEKIRLHRETLQQQQSAAALASSVAAAPKWNTGGSAAATKNAKQPSQSLDEIMQQEELARQQQLAGGPTANLGVRVAAPAGSWAAKAAKAAPSGSYASIPVSPVLKTSPGTAGIKPAVIHKEVESFWNFTDNKGEGKLSAAAPIEKSVLRQNEASAGGMPHAFAEWSISELKKLSNKDDHLTLIQLCYTLESAVEIREYFAEYLGSTPQVF